MIVTYDRQNIFIVQATGLFQHFKNRHFISFSETCWAQRTSATSCPRGRASPAWCKPPLTRPPTPGGSRSRGLKCKYIWRGEANRDHLKAIFVERKVRYSALFLNLVAWHASAVSFHLRDVILAQLACPLSDVMFCLDSGRTNLSLYKHCLKVFLLWWLFFLSCK